MKTITRSPQETQSLGVVLGQFLGPGDILFLTGELGSGKTILAQGIAVGLGVTEAVTSPSFVLVNEYRGRWPFYHLDLYRLSRNDLPALGLEEYLDGPGIVVIEWPEVLGNEAVGNYLQVTIRPLGGDRREVLFCPVGKRAAEIVRQLRLKITS